MTPPETLSFADDTGGANDEFIISPAREISAYETLWARHMTVKRMADLFREHQHALPSKVATKEGVTEAEIETIRNILRKLLHFSAYSALFYRDFEYPAKLQDARHPVEVLYYRGALDLLSSRCVSVVGARKPTEAGRKRAAKVARLLVEHDCTVVSGLAEGIDTAAHEAALAAGGRTIAVIGTPLNEVYPKSNYTLQERIADEYLLISQVPFYLASQRNWRANRFFFPERNKTMSALSEATVIVEAAESSGTLIQAHAALEQGRQLFILNSCFDKGLAWPEKYMTKGAIRIARDEDIIDSLNKASFPA